MKIECTVEELKELIKNSTKIKIDGTKVGNNIVPSLNNTAKELGYKSILSE